MLDKLLLYRYCDELLRIANAGNRINVPMYGTGKYRRDLTELSDVFIAMGATEDYAVEVIRVLKEHELIFTKASRRMVENNREIGIYNVYINDNGEHFIKSNSFLKIHHEAILREHAEKMNLEKTRQDLEIGKWLLKTKWLPHLFSIAGIAWGVYVFIDAKADSKKQQQQTEDLQEKLQETKNEIYTRMDSFYRIEHSSMTAKKK